MITWLNKKSKITEGTKTSRTRKSTLHEALIYGRSCTPPKATGAEIDDMATLHGSLFRI